MTDLIIPKGQEPYNGLDDKNFERAMAAALLSIETMNNRQRWIFRKALKEYAKNIKIRWPNGRPFEDIQNEIAVMASKEIIKPK